LIPNLLPAPFLLEMDHHTWDAAFLELFSRCLKRYRAGDRDYPGYFGADELSFLDSIGYRTREFFDFVEDFAEHEDPSPSTALLVASVRRDYFRWVMKGEKSEQLVLPKDLPSRDSELGGFRWLPRILVKAQAKLRGELDPEIMYCCGGDRNFLRSHEIAPADFLRAVWAAGEDDAKVLEFVQAHTP